MKVSCDEGLANHIGSESCIGVRKGDSEALTGECTGWVLSCEIYTPPRGGTSRSADAVEASGRQHLKRRQGETFWNSAQSQTPSMYRNTSFGNREIPWASAIAGCAERVGKSNDVADNER